MLIAFKLKIGSGLRSGLAGPLAVAPPADARTRSGTPDCATSQAILELHPGAISYRVNGDFTRAGRQAAAPLRHDPLRQAARRS